MSWEPSASATSLRARAALLHNTREFFTARGYLEVETPLLAKHTVTDLHIESFCTTRPKRYLQTSPEFFMKRLLAQYQQPIFQICKAFRQEEAGHQHNPEFTLLEWYHPNYTHHELMDEMNAYLRATITSTPAKKISYAELFEQHLKLNPHTCDTALLKHAMHQHNIDIDTNQLTRDDCLQLLMSYVLEPQLPKHTPVFIYDYPTSQAALATIRYDTPPVAERFEVYLNSIELANGFHELTDVDEQKKRFLHDQQTRIQHHKASVSIDQKFLSCLPHLPPCSGVALGIDRLLMLQLNTRHIREVISFDWPSL